MGFALLFIGLLMVVTGARGTYAQFGSQIASEFQGNNSFTYQMIALGAIGAAGYIPALQTISRWILAFIVLVIMLGGKGQQSFFGQLQAALKQGPTPPNATGTAATSAPGAAGVGIGGLSNPTTSPAAQQNPGVIDNWLQKFGFPSWTYAPVQAPFTP
jgi:hypothetical protein